MTTSSELKDGMRIDWDMPVQMDDGVVLRADVFRPPGGGRYPVILGATPYGKWLSFQDEVWGGQWRMLCAHEPEILQLSSNKYQNYEFPDPERFVPEGYALVRVDVRGTGRSPGFMDLLSARETKDLYECIEWAARQPWSNGRVGLNGVSYLAMNQWQVAALQPPHLAAICVWEGCSDFYREFTRHGGIYSLFGDLWIEKYVHPVQHGRGARGWRSNINGEWVSGPQTLSEEELAARRKELGELAAESRKKEVALAAARTRQAALFAQVHETARAEERQVTALADKSERLAALLDLLEGRGRALAPGAASIRKYRGALDWPIKGPVVVPFGRIANPKFPKTFLRSSGWTLEASPGTPVHAVFSGDVVYAQWLKGYGNLVVVDHGDGVFTLYGRLATGTVGRGEHLALGDAVGLLGESPEDEPAGLYFEIRDNRTSADPAAWLR